MQSRHGPMPDAGTLQPRSPRARPLPTTPNGDLDPVSVRRQRTRTFDYVWRSFVAGGLAGCVAKSVVAPLDRVKILFQSSNPRFAKYSGSWVGVATALDDIYRQDGPAGLFRGHSATLLRIFPYAAIKFVAYEQIRAVLIDSREHETPLRRLVSGSLAGVTSVFFTYPLEVVRVRLAFETQATVRPTLVSICRQIFYEHPRAVAAGGSSRGPTHVTAAAAAAAAPSPQSQSQTQPRPRGQVGNFYRGFAPTVMGMIPYAGVSFLTHDTAGDFLRRPSLAQWTTLPARADSPPDRPLPLRTWAELLAGGLAGMVSQTASYPFEIIRRRMQVGGAVGDGHRMRIGETMRLIVAERGARGFFVGLSIGYVKTIPMAASSFFVYERVKMWLGI